MEAFLESPATIRGEFATKNLHISCTGEEEGVTAQNDMVGDVLDVVKETLVKLSLSGAKLEFQIFGRNDWFVLSPASTATEAD